MGQKVNPHGLRVGIIKDWDSKWYAEGDFADCLVEDYKIREFLKDRLYNAGISKIEIERASEKVKIIIYRAIFILMQLECHIILFLNDSSSAFLFQPVLPVLQMVPEPPAVSGFR